MPNPWTGVKQSRAKLVKQAPRFILAGALALLCLTLAPLAHADTDSVDANLPEIDAKAFVATVVRRSTSGHVYLFESSEDLHAGKILLFRQPESGQADSGLPIMAFRVLRDYPSKGQFAAKWVREYRGIDQLTPGHSYDGIEKIADRAAPPLTEEDRNELKEIESEPPPPPVEGEQAKAPTAKSPVKSYDPELDATTSPPPKSTSAVANVAVLSPQDEADLDDLQNITAQELVPLERDKNWFSMGLGYFRNNGASSGANMGYLGGLDLKYARSLKTMIYFKRNNLQDSIALEGGLGYYRLVNFSSSNDSFSVLPLTVTLRYNLNFGDNFAMFLYMGVNQNMVLTYGTANSANQTAVNAAASQLTSLLPAIGTGLLFHVGPGWYIRADLGLDLLALGFTLRY